MAQTKLTIINPETLRLACECGEYVHEIRKSEDGGIEVETFAKPKPTKREPAEETPPAPAPKKRRSFFD